MIALIRMSAGLIVWAAAFCVLYGLHGIGCAAGWPAVAMPGTDLHRMVLLLAWLFCLAVGGVVLLWVRRMPDERDLIDRTARRVAAIGIVATAITGLPILTLPACL